MFLFLKSCAVRGRTSATSARLWARTPSSRGCSAITVYRAHLGLVAPAGACALRVGSHVRFWSEGDVFVFDDTVNFEAWNRTGGTRTVPLFDFLRPGRTMDELDEVPPEVAAALQRGIR